MMLHHNGNEGGMEKGSFQWMTAFSHQIFIDQYYSKVLCPYGKINEIDRS